MKIHSPISALASLLRFASPALCLHVFPFLPFALSPALPFGLKALLRKRDFLVAVVALAKKIFVLWAAGENCPGYYMCIHLHPSILENSV